MHCSCPELQFTFMPKDIQLPRIRAESV